MNVYVCLVNVVFLGEASVGNAKVLTAVGRWVGRKDPYRNSHLTVHDLGVTFFREGTQKSVQN